VKQRKLDHIAQSAIKFYEGIFPSVTFFAKETSTIYKTINSKGQEFALKIYDEASSNLDDNLIEVLMLDAIQEKSNITIASIIKNKKEQHFTLVPDDSSSRIYRIVLSKWIEGIDFKNKESKERFFDLGKLVGEMHLATENIELPKNLIPKKWNQVYYFRDETPVYHHPKFNHLVSSEFKTLMDSLVPFLNPLLKEIYQSSKSILLHGDLNPWNIKTHKNQFSILDFEDAILGPPIHELAILLFYYRKGENFPYTMVKDALFTGYRSVRDLPLISDLDLEMLFMARKVNFLNHVLTLEGDYKKYLQEGTMELKEFALKHL